MRCVAADGAGPVPLQHPSLAGGTARRPAPARRAAAAHYSVVASALSLGALKPARSASSAVANHTSATVAS